MVCMNVVIHKKNYEGYKDRKTINENQQKFFKELQKKNETILLAKKATHPSFSGSDTTVNNEKWREAEIKWTYFEDVSSMPYSSRNTGKAPVRDDDEQYSEEGAHEEEEDDQDDASEWSSWVV